MTIIYIIIASFVINTKNKDGHVTITIQWILLYSFHQTLINLPQCFSSQETFSKLTETTHLPAMT